MGIAANKYDLFKNQQVKEDESKKFAEEIGAILHNTSAKESVGIDGLFQDIGEKILQLNNQTVSFDETIMKTKIFNDNKKKKKCC